MDDAFIGEFERHLKKRGLRSGRLYGFAARRLSRWARSRGKEFREVDPVLLHEYLVERRKPEHRPTTIKAEIDRLRLFFSFAVSRGAMIANSALGVSHFWLDEPGGLPAYRGVLRRLFRHPRDILRFRLPLFAPHWEPYLEHLLERGYSRGSLYHVLEHCAHFHAFLLERGRSQLDQVSVRLLEDYLAEAGSRSRREHGRPLTDRYHGHIRNAIEKFLEYTGLLKRPPTRARAGKDRALIPDALLDGHARYCRTHRGLSAVTTKTYRRELNRFRSFLARRGVKHLESLAVGDLDAFLMRRAKTMSPKSLESISAAMRSLLRYLHLEGRIQGDLAAVVASPSRFSADLRPKYIAWAQVEQMLKRVEGQGLAAKRDFAILVLSADLGLRARETAALRIEDIDLQRRSILLLRRKNGSTVDLPIGERACRAIRDYLAVRRSHSSPRLFLSVRAPVEPLSGTGISCVVQRRLRCLPGAKGGAYALRHSFAKLMLDRGARLAEIGSLLGHKSLRSTLIYTRIAVEDMREVADNYAALL